MVMANEQNILQNNEILEREELSKGYIVVCVYFKNKVSM